MCGIVGLISKRVNGFDFKAAELFTSMLQMDSIRGEDSTGVFGVDADGKVDIIKADTHAWQFTRCKQYGDFEHRIYSTYRIVVGHNRAATKGKVTAENAHPFKADNITCVHNGTIYNHDELDSSTEVDSHAITKELAKKDAKAALNSIHGPFALVWYDATQQTINLARNNDRPLFLLDYEDWWAVSSEPGLPYWLAGRDGSKVLGPPKIVPVERLLQFKLDELARGFQEVEYDNYVWKSTYTAPTFTAPIRPQGEPHLHIVHPSSSKSTTLTWKQGDEIVFKAEDLKHEEGDRDWTLFGHPVFEDDDEIDSNILIKASIGNEIEARLLFSAPLVSGTVSGMSMMGNMPVIFTRFVSPVVKDANGNKSIDAQIQEAIAKGCGRCKGTMAFTEIASSIVRKRKDGTYRTLCVKCLTESQKKVPVQQRGALLAN